MENIGKKMAPVIMGIGGIGLAGVLYSSLYATISGVVYDELGAGIEGVTISLDGQIVVTGSDGMYAFRALSGNYVISFSKDGYYTIIRALSVTMGSSIILDIPMKEAIVDPTGMILCAPLSEGAGSIVMDISQYGHNGLLGGGTEAYMPVWTTLANGRRCLSFDGKDDIIQYSGLSIQEGGPATIAGWFRFNTTAKTRSMDVFLLSRLLYQHSSNDLLYIHGTNDFFQTFKPVAGRWYHIILTYDGNTSSAVLSVNKTRYNVVQQAGPHTISAFAGVLGNLYDHLYEFGFDGLISGANMAFTRVTTDSERDALYDAESPLYV